MNLAARLLMIGTSSVAITLAGCDAKTDPPTAGTPEVTGDHDHDHDHDHDDEVDLGSTAVGDMTVSCAQGHGELAAGKELHICVKLPHNDNGATVVRAWIGTEDRTASMVGKGEYMASHDDYEIHAEAPDPLPENAMWWIEVELPDGTRSVGSIKPH